MDKWFSGPPKTKPSFASPDESTIKMDAWALKVPRAKAAFDEMVAKKIWASPKAIADVWPKRAATLGPGCFDISGWSVPKQHEMHVNFQAVTDGWSLTLDDMVAALGNFSIYVTPLALEITPEKGKTRVTLQTVGFHIMDSFDFNGDQSLGYWNEADNSASATPTWSGDKVTNESFRNWRATNGRGGDFLVYSDVTTVKLSPPESFLV